jgi:hypothetical protein
MVLILCLVLVGCMWIVGDMEFRTKAILTLLYLASFGLMFVPERSYLFLVSQCILAAVIGFKTFGADFLSRRM